VSQDYFLASIQLEEKLDKLQDIIQKAEVVIAESQG